MRPLRAAVAVPEHGVVCQPCLQIYRQGMAGILAGAPSGPSGAQAGQPATELPVALPAAVPPAGAAQGPAAQGDAFTSQQLLWVNSEFAKVNLKLSEGSEENAFVTAISNLWAKRDTPKLVDALFKRFRPNTAIPRGKDERLHQLFSHLREASA